MRTNRLAVGLAAVMGLSTALPAMAQQELVTNGEIPSFDEVDNNLDGAITSVEFSRQFSELDQPSRLFEQADDDGNDEIDRREWNEFREQRMAEAQPTQPAEPAEAQLTPQRRQQTFIEVAITDEAIMGEYITDAGLVGLPGNRIAFGGLFTDDRDIMGQGELMAPGLIAQFLPDIVTVALGGRGYLGLLDDPDDDVFGIAPGAEVRVQLPIDYPVEAVGNLFYGPNILTFGDADTVVDFELRAEAQFLERTFGFVGYRFLNFEREEASDDSLLNSIEAGLRFAF